MGMDISMDMGRRREDGFRNVAVKRIIISRID